MNFKDFNYLIILNGWDTIAKIILLFFTFSLFTPTDMGEYVLFILFLTMSQIICMFAGRAIVLRDIELDSKNLPNFLKTLATIQIVSILVLAAFTLFYSLYFTPLINISLILILAVTLLSGAKKGHYSNYLLFEKKVRKNSLIEAFSITVANFLIILFLYFNANILILASLQFLKNMIFLIIAGYTVSLPKSYFDRTCITSRRMGKMSSAVALQILQEVSQRFEVIIIAIIADSQALGLISRAQALLNASTNLVLSPIKDYVFIRFRKQADGTIETGIWIFFLILCFNLHGILLFLNTVDYPYILKKYANNWDDLPIFIVLCIPLFSARSLRKLMIHYISAKQDYNFISMTHLFYIFLSTMLIYIFDIRDLGTLLQTQAFLLALVYLASVLRVRQQYMIPLWQQFCFVIFPVSFIMY